MNSMCENQTIKVSFDFYRVSDVTYRNFRVRLRTCISEMTLGALIGTGALNRAKTVLAKLTTFSFLANTWKAKIYQRLQNYINISWKKLSILVSIAIIQDKT